MCQWILNSKIKEEKRKKDKKKEIKKNRTIQNYLDILSVYFSNYMEAITISRI